LLQQHLVANSTKNCCNNTTQSAQPCPSAGPELSLSWLQVKLVFIVSLWTQDKLGYYCISRKITCGIQSWVRYCLISLR
jgi:hypothetical protein